MIKDFLFVVSFSYIIRKHDLLNLDIGAGVPHLRRVLAVPAEGEDIVPGLKVLRHLHHQVPEGPGIGLARGGGQVYLGPLRVPGGGAVGVCHQVNGDPARLVEILIIGLPVDPLCRSYHKWKIKLCQEYAITLSAFHHRSSSAPLGSTPQ